MAIQQNQNTDSLWRTIVQIFNRLFKGDNQNRTQVKPSETEVYRKGQSPTHSQQEQDSETSKSSPSVGTMFNEPVNERGSSKKNIQEKPHEYSDPDSKRQDIKRKAPPPPSLTKAEKKQRPDTVSNSQDAQNVQPNSQSSSPSHSSSQNDQNSETSSKTGNTNPFLSNSEIQTKINQPIEVVEPSYSVSYQQDQTVTTNKKIQNNELLSTNQNSEVESRPLPKDDEFSSTFNSKQDQTMTTNKKIQDNELLINQNTVAESSPLPKVDELSSDDSSQTLEKSTKSLHHENNDPTLITTIPSIIQEGAVEDKKQNIDKDDEKEVAVSSQKTTEKTSETTSTTQEETSAVNEFVESTIKKIVSIRQEVAEQEDEIKAFPGISSDDRDYTYMDELMMRNLIKLDNIETGNNPKVRQARKEGIQFIQGMLKKLDAKLKENQAKTNKVVPTNHEDDQAVDTSTETVKTEKIAGTAEKIDGEAIEETG